MASLLYYVVCLTCYVCIEITMSSFDGRTELPTTLSWIWSLSTITSLSFRPVLSLDSVLLYSSADQTRTNLENPNEDTLPDSNTYLPFVLADSTVTNRIGEELDALSEMDEEGEPFGFAFLIQELGVWCTYTQVNFLYFFMHSSCVFLTGFPGEWLIAPCQLVGALTKALCCECAVFSCPMLLAYCCMLHIATTSSLCVAIK